jgi:hypothetical protein
MKRDEATLVAGYGSIGGFSLRQLIRHLLGKDIKAMALYQARSLDQP